MRKLVITLGLGALMTGCAGAPKIEVSSSGAGPAKAATFRFAAAAGEAPVGPLIQPQIETRLVALGYRRAEADARYVIETAATARPLTVGAYVKSPDAWLDKPRLRGPKKAGLCQVSVRFIDARSGAEAYRVSVLQQRTKAGCAVQDPQLADAALSEIPLPVSPPKPGRSGG